MREKQFQSRQQQQQQQYERRDDWDRGDEFDDNNNQLFRYDNNEFQQASSSTGRGREMRQRQVDSSWNDNNNGGNRYERRGRDFDDMAPPPPMYEDEESDYESISPPFQRQSQQRYESSRDDEEEQSYQSNTRPEERQYQTQRSDFNGRQYRPQRQPRYQTRSKQQSSSYTPNERPTTRQIPQSPYGPGNSFDPQRGYRGPSRRQRSSTGIRGMFDRLLNPYATSFGMMKRVNNEMKRSMTAEQQSSARLLSDARDILLNDIAVKNMLGTDISLGTPISRTSSSSTVNGQTRSRLELVIPVSGSANTGRICLTADQDGIMQLELDVGGRLVNIPLNRRRWNEDDDVIDANVLDREVY